MPARACRLLPVAILAALLFVGCSSQPDQSQTLGKILPADTLAWLHLDDLPALEDALDAYGLMDSLVAELDKPETREELEAETGLVLSEDPRQDIHALMQELVRGDISAHTPLHVAAGDEAPEHPVVVIHLECIDEAAAGRVMEMVKPHTDGEVTVGAHMAFKLDAEEDLSFVIGHHGAHVLVATEAERWGEIMGGIVDPPAAGLVDTEAYQKVVAAELNQVAIYITPEFQTEMKGLTPPQPGMDPAAMFGLMEKWGSQYMHYTMDYLITEIVGRQMLTAGSPLLPLYVCADGDTELQAKLPAGTFFYEGWLVENGRAKMELIGELLKDTMGVMSESAPDQMPPGSEDPVTSVEQMIGFTLADMAERVREVALVGAESPGWLLMLRAPDETLAQELTDMFVGIPMLAMLGPATELSLGETTFYGYGAPGDTSGKLNLMGRHGDTFMMAIQVPDAAAMEAFLAQAGDDALLGSVPAHALRQLKHAGSGWGYLDLRGMMTAVGQDPAEIFEDMPPALADRMRALKIAGFMTMPGDGIIEVMMETGQP